MSGARQIAAPLRQARAQPTHDLLKSSAPETLFVVATFIWRIRAISGEERPEDVDKGVDQAAAITRRLPNNGKGRRQAGGAGIPEIYRPMPLR
jgi:hypothetical protein